MPDRALLAILCAVFMLALPARAEDRRNPLVFGVFGFLGIEETRAKYQPIVDYLNQTLKHERIILKVLDQPELEAAMMGGALDIVTTNPTHFLVARKLVPATRVVASLVAREGEQPVRQLGGVILVRADRDDLRTLNDLRNKVVATPSLKHMGGYRAQAYELFLAGIHLPKDAARVILLSGHQAVVRSVLAGEAEVGFVRSGIIEMMLQDGSLQAGEIKLINPMFHPTFPFRSSTRLYPEWPVFALPYVDDRSLRHVAAALYSLEPDHPAARAAGIYGYTAPMDYLPVEDLSRALRLPPFDEMPYFTLQDAWEKWKPFVILSLLLGLLIAFLSVALVLALRRARSEKDRSASLLAGLGEGVYGCDMQGLSTFINPAALRMLGLTEAEVLGRDQHLLFHHHKPDGAIYPHTECPIHQTLSDGMTRHVEEWFFRADGSGFPVDLVVTPTRTRSGQFTGAVVAFQDITQRKALEAEFQRLATTDALTALANRRHFLDQIEQELARIHRFAEPAALLMLDLDHFKNINDQYGHAAGDAVLKALAQVMTDSLRKTDRAARWGGEEFALLLPETPAEAALDFAERLRSSVEALPIAFENLTLHVTISIGVTDLNQEDIESAMKKADRALYLAKERGRNRVELLLS